MSEWTPQDDWSQVKVGDTVRAEREGCVITGEVIDRYRRPYDTETYALIVRVAGLVDSFRLDRPEWQLSVPAKPAVELPTEAGTVVRTRDFAVWQIFKGGLWLNTATGNAEAFTPESFAERIARYGSGFEVLEPVAVTAKKVINHIGEIVDSKRFSNIYSVLGEAEKEFGVIND